MNEAEIRELMHRMDEAEINIQDLQDESRESQKKIEKLEAEVKDLRENPPVRRHL